MSKNKKKQQPYKPTDDELAAAPRAFQYELCMFRQCLQMLSFFESPCAVMVNECLRNSLLEATLLHVRNILDFFTRDRPVKGAIDQDSIRAGYFVQGYCAHAEDSWKTFDLPFTKSHNNDINSSLSHLTFARVRGDYKWDDLPKIRTEIESAYAEFFRLLPETDRARWSAPEE